MNDEFCSIAERWFVVQPLLQIFSNAIASGRDMVMRCEGHRGYLTTMKTIATVNLVCNCVGYTKQLIVR